ncbi:Ig-like domain-containing protein [Massilia scottii]|uniref:Ig-like domain-containing protein n=1 Tax=Massilia scottii TaxID=3057166 RepID=UPI0027969C77|nr:Ig-like domain-containing protein [Massilia sp. CCM 9029]MDQ1833275.1 Ig-like domain-containing protein [Massilia sp. CCM 9029]
MQLKNCIFWCGLAFCAASPAQAQLNESCVVSVLNRNVQARPDGTWVLPNIPANFGSVRARATCVQGGVTSYGESVPFTIPVNGSVTLPRIALGPTTPVPTSVRVNVATELLATAGATTQAQALATYTGSPAQVDVSASGTSYSISNPAIATITAGGLITAVSSGTVVVQAIHEGTQGIAQVRVALAGVDRDGDGVPDADELRLGMDPANPADAMLDLDHDGLTARDEFLAGTDPRKADSDGDGLGDGAEARCPRATCSSPLLSDTDGDGIHDGTEIATGSDPANAASYNLAAALASLRVTPGNFTLTVNTLSGSASVQLTVTGTMIDGRDINLTSAQRQTTYASSNLANCNFGAPDGRVYASQAGRCQITVSNNGKSASVAGTVTDFAPAQRSFLIIPGYGNAVAVNSDYAFIASGAAGMQVVSLSADRRTPKIVAALGLGGDAYDITLAGNIAYLATSVGLKVVDVSVPTLPKLLGSFGKVGSALGVKVRGSTAYVAAGSSLYLISVANPGAMIQVGAVVVGGTAWNLDLDPARNLAAVAAGSAGLQLVDISNLSAPLLRGGVATGDARGVALRGNAAIVADYVNSMTSVDIANLAAPTVMSRTPELLGGLLNNVVLSGNFALGADMLFANGVPIVDISNPAALQSRSILRFTTRDDNGIGIAVDDRDIYLVADAEGFERGGSDGNSLLYIGQYQPRTDLAGVAPSAAITRPAAGSQFYEGTPLTVAVDAVDDIAVAAVRFQVDGQAVFTSTAAPYQYTFTVPVGVSRLTLGAAARDLGGNEGSAAPVSVAVAPDPLTTVVGLVVNAAGEALPGALVSAPGGRTAITNAAGRFQIAGVPTVLGSLVVGAQYAPAGGAVQNGASPVLAPVPGGETQAGTITVIAVRFETDYGVNWPSCDDCSLPHALPFSFPFYGQGYTSAWISHNGYLTFDAPDSTYREDVGAFSQRKRIAAFFDDLIGGTVFVNDRLPGQFIVTYERTLQYGTGGSNTLQIQLFSDGRVVFAYKGISALGTGSISGLTPGPGAPFRQVDFGATPTLTLPAGTAIYEYFTETSRFDLDQAFIDFAPLAGGGYHVRTVMPAAAAPVATLVGTVAAPVQALSAPSQLRATVQRGGGARAHSMANAEVRVFSSGNPHYLGMTNTDSRGGFTLGAVPAGGISVEVWRDGQLIGRGAGVTRDGGADLVNIELVGPDLQPKGGRAK